ncbi:MAG: hypothetical protein GW858_01505 [Sphingomonadales bacterium]|nr:hypothetical protein [Sphingomonadales bacterium]NCQ19892.1 hypothetical protein [Sphingomonadales bacterium]NCT05129.1 hypothetical protein [Sphingomonadales bacterium]
MIARIIWFAALGIVALLTSALQFDMASKRMPGLATVIPGPLRNQAQARIVEAKLAGTDVEGAVAEAELLVRRRPVPAENLTMLAVAQAKAGQPEAAARTIQIAGQRGWRDPLVQEAVLRIALGAGDKPEAARRYAALFLRARTSDRLLKDLGPAVLGEPGGLGQQTMVAVVVGGERWQPTFLRRGVQVMPPAVFSAIAAASLMEGATFDCGALGQSITALGQRDTRAGYNLAVAASGRCPELAPAGMFPL